MAKKKSLMDALSEYQEGNEFGRAQKKEEREKKMGSRAAKAKTNTKKAFSGEAFLKTDKVKTPSRRNGAGERTPLSGGAGGSRPSRSSSGGGTSKPKSGSGGGSSSGGSSNRGSGTTGQSLPSNPQLKSQRGKGGTYGRPMPSNPPGINSKPKPGDYKTRQAFLNALEKWMKKKNRATNTRNSVEKKTTKVMDGRQYGG